MEVQLYREFDSKVFVQRCFPIRLPVANSSAVLTTRRPNLEGCSRLTTTSTTVITALGGDEVVVEK